MTKPKIYVKSRGFSQNHDYRWVDEKNQLQEEPDAVTKVQHLIESESFSVVIARGNDERGQEYLLLLITGIKSREREKERKDFRNRNILTSVAWIYDNPDENDEQYIRLIASNVLDSNVSDSNSVVRAIDNSIKDKDIDTTGHGFKVNFETLVALGKLVPEIKDEKPELKQKLRKNLDETKEELSKELKNSRLPTSQELKKEGLMSKNTALVVVTGIKSESAFKEAGIWRGLSNLVGEGNNQMEKKSSKSWVFPVHFDYKIAIIVIVLCASLIINALQFNIIRQKNQEIQKLTNQVERLGNQKQSLDELQDLQRPYQELGKKIQDLQRQYEELGKQFQKVLEKSNISSL